MPTLFCFVWCLLFANRIKVERVSGRVVSPQIRVLGPGQEYLQGLVWSLTAARARSGTAGFWGTKAVTQMTLFPAPVATPVHER